MSSDATKTVVMVCYHFPPVSAAGTQRNVGFVRRLPQFAWKPLVLTVNAAKNTFERSGEPVPSDVEVVRSPEWDLQRVMMIATGISNRFCDLFGIRRSSLFFDWCLPDPQMAWLTTWQGIRLARRAACIYASCAPFSAAISACLMKRVTGKPVVLDFRDAWALNPHSNLGRAQRTLIAKLERWVLRTCDILILNTPGAERCYKRTYPEYARKMTCIPNGFDRLNVPDGMRTDGKFTIMHVGDFYRSRTPTKLLQALAVLNNPDIEFVQVGPGFDAYHEYKDRVPIRLIDRVTHAEALQLMQSASLLYLCQGWETGVTDYIAVATKTYEYLATGLPVLADCPPGDNADIVRTYASRAWVLTSTDVAEFRRALVEAYESRHVHRPHVTPSFVETFSREYLARRLAGVLDAAAAGVARVEQVPRVSAREPSEFR